MASVLQSGYVSKHEGQSKVLLSDSSFLLFSLCCRCLVINLDWYMIKFHLGWPLCWIFCRAHVTPSLLASFQFLFKGWNRDTRVFRLMYFGGNIYNSEIVKTSFKVCSYFSPEFILSSSIVRTLVWDWGFNVPDLKSCIVVCAHDIFHHHINNTVRRLGIS